MVHRLDAVVQRGFRQVLHDIADDAKEDALSLSDDEDAAETSGEGTPRARAADAGPSTSRAGSAPKRTLSRVSSLRLAPDGDGDASVMTPWNPNQFMDVAPGEGSAQAGGSRKRTAGERSPSPANKRGRFAK